ncbi:helix-turn-helix domain-containing protein [Nitrobacter sp. TKz-YC02]|uniref:helix-turn-helix domain-containing protein n=1 Tax=Nitrobacter sp. TKz-YC02 TaxID=3398704 RepID=UPI003CF7F5DC
MIIVEIPKKELLRQLPEKAGYALLAYFEELPQTFRFEALPLKTDSQVLEKHYPALRRKATPSQWILFVGLHERGRVSSKALFNLLRRGPERKEFEVTSNIIQIHIKNLRRLLAETATPLHIITHRGGGMYDGQYEMKRLPREEDRYRPTRGGNGRL